MASEGRKTLSTFLLTSLHHAEDVRGMDTPQELDLDCMMELH